MDEKFAILKWRKLLWFSKKLKIWNLLNLSGIFFVTVDQKILQSTEKWGN